MEGGAAGLRWLPLAGLDVVEVEAHRESKACCGHRRRGNSVLERDLGGRRSCRSAGNALGRMVGIGVMVEVEVLMLIWGSLENGCTYPYHSR